MVADRTRLVAVDGLRGFAIAIVLLAHIHEALGYPFIQYDAVFATVDFVRSGVDLFFVLSGFCLYYPLTKLGRTPGWRSFFRRRARRLLPPYYVALLAILFLPYLVAPLAGRLGLVTEPYTLPTWHLIWTHLLFVHPFFADSFYSLNPALWSLGIEIQFYLAFPLAVFLVSRVGWRGVALIAAVTLGYRAWISAPPAIIAAWPIDLGQLFPSRWLEFGLGMLVAAQIRARGSVPLARSRELLDFLGILVFYLLGAYFLYGPLGHYSYAHKDLLFSACYAMLLYLTCAEGSLLGRLFSWNPLVRLGIISYSVYLIHAPIIFALAPSIDALDLANYTRLVLLTLIALPPVIACSALFYQFVERPFLNTAPTGLAQAAPLPPEPAEFGALLPQRSQ